MPDKYQVQNRQGEKLLQAALSKWEIVLNKWEKLDYLLFRNIPRFFHY